MGRFGSSGGVRWGLGLVVLVGLGGCSSCESPTFKPRENAPNLQWCPGSPGCLTEDEDTIQAGAARRSILPLGFEIANPAYLKSTGCDPIYLQRFGVDRCGELPNEEPGNCGTDGLCPGDPGYTAPDSNGTERDQTSGATSYAARQDWFFDCGLDRICPTTMFGRQVTHAGAIPEPESVRSNGVDDDGDGAVDEGEYPGPDSGEGDGIFQAVWIAGFGTNRPAVGSAEDVDVRCLALRTAQTTAVVCSLDVVGFFNEEIVSAREKLRERHPEAEVDYLAVQSTHTHENVDTMGQWGRATPVPITPGRLEGHNAFIVDQIVEAAAEAAGSLRPARLVQTQVRTGLDLLRDSRDPQVLDDTMTVVEAREAQGGNTIFTAVHWANHPEVLSDENNFMSADFAAYLRKGVEQGLPSLGLQGRGGLTVYMQGTVGGLMTPLGVTFTGRDGVVYPANPATFARVRAYGESLAADALEALAQPNLTETTRGVLKVKAERFYIPIRNRVFIFAFSAGLFDRLAYDVDGYPIDPQVTSLLEVEGSGRTEVFTLDLGPWSMVGVPGELFPEVAVGGFDGSYAGGRPILNENRCPPPASCAAEQGECPVERPVDGWLDCACERCRRCAPLSLQQAPPGPYVKDHMPGQFRMVLGLANDELGYMVPPYDWRVSETAPFFCDMEDHYEETNSASELAVPRFETALKRLTDFAL